MTIDKKIITDKKIIDEKIPNDNNVEAANISAAGADTTSQRG